MTSYKDIRAETGLALSTISKHFNGLPVRPENRAAIEAAAARLGYRPNVLASGLRSQRSRTVGVLLPVLDNGFHLALIAGVEAALRPAGLSVIVSSSPDASTGATELLRSRQVDGIIAVASPHDLEALRRAAREIPVVLIDWEADVPGSDGVFLDNREAGRIAARHLLDHGHRALAVVGGDRSISTTNERTEGFLREAADAGAAVAPELVTSGPLTIEQGRRAMGEILLRRDRPTAVFSSNYELTLGSVIAMNESGLRIGEDISLIGFDGTDLARALQPTLTHVEQPEHEIAAHAAARLRTRLDGGRSAGPERVLLMPRLITGGSVRRR
ncbi:LacI family DNA-binding transcriptional regulator [Brachybacterium sp. J144]|uniref:LacI family DNA-binding transcriptional regulator n=1 Tax=Brachybacterium sp. J144 TaxID=3116487 RepID=UPI002E77E097|nr:LacI family DNA-binding transcriptional regulator [Brachybacterium sp. J144]MEE1651416.1 LacI family DNA-binding transcriptional regulator [Brachybacterium sp. J144]